MGRNVLILSDLQCPFEHPKALEFCTYLKRHFKISETVCIGDETDQYWGGQWQKDINAKHTALSEISETKEKLKPWYELFPKLKICTSNHGLRWQRKAVASDIPEILMRRYEEVLGCPQTWAWADRWVIDTKHPFTCEHGDRFGGQYPHVMAALNNGMSTAIGHFHSIGGVEWVKTPGYEMWAMATASMIDFPAYAFKYAHKAKRIPLIGTSVVLDDGRLPIWVPLE